MSLSMSDCDADIFVAGGGIAGRAAAAAFGWAGFRVICVDPAPADRPGTATDLRTTAFLQPARALLERIGVWPLFAEAPAPLAVMRIVDAAGAPPVSRDFEAVDIGEAAFGWNLRNETIRAALTARLDALPNVEMRHGVGFRSLLPREDMAHIRLSDGETLTARMVLACDGRDSAVREAAGIGARTIRYGQKALSFAVTHPVPHDNVSTEIHRAGGPFTLVPLPDVAGQPASAVVWMERGPEALRLSRLDRAAFEAAATERSTGLFGPLSLVAGPQVWPIISRIADRLDGPRTALMGEAAHVVPPIGAQGLNMSLADLDALLTLAAANPTGIGSRAMLADYNRQRHSEIALRVAGIDALNRASMSGNPALQGLRRAGVQAFHDLVPVRKGLMRLGLGLGR